MHKYQVTSAAVLPIATEDIAGKTDAGTDAAGQDLGDRGGLPTSVVAQDSTSSGNLGVAFTPHAQSLQPIVSSSDPQHLTPTSDQQLPQPQPTKASGVAARRRATVETGSVKDKPKPLQRKRSMSLQATEAVELTKNYEQLVREFNILRPFTRCPDGSYPRDTKCIICRRARPRAVFFPCQHRCVCDDCIASHRISPDRTNPSNWCACPVCMGDICLILAHSGKEEEKYWKWVMEVQPRLSSQFKLEFKETARRLEKGTTTASVTFDSEDAAKHQSSDTLDWRHQVWQQPGQQAAISRRKSFSASRKRSTCSIL